MEKEIKNSVHFRNGIFTGLTVLSLMWLVKFVQLISGASFAHFGLKPREIRGLVGVLTAPFIHSSEDWNHILSNSIPIVVLIFLIYITYHKIANKVLFTIWLMTGLWTWVFARGDTYHIGASGVIYGLLSFLFFSGLWRKNKNGIAMALLMVLLYGSMFWGLFPIKEGVSWESHLMGFFSGLILSLYYKDILITGAELPKKREDDKPVNFTYDIPYDVTYVYKERSDSKED